MLREIATHGQKNNHLFDTGTAEAALCGSKHWSLAAQDGWGNTGGLVLLPFSSARDGGSLKGNYTYFG